MGVRGWKLFVYRRDVGFSLWPILNLFEVTSLSLLDLVIYMGRHDHLPSFFIYLYRGHRIFTIANPTPP